jgi:RND superfamily putative drug exporter
VATFLSRLGRLAFRRRWSVALLWLAVLGAVGVASATASELPDDTKSMPGIEAQAALDLMTQRFGANAGNLDRATARVVFVAPAGEKITDAGHRATIDALVQDVSRGSQVAGAVNPFPARAVSQDGSTAYAVVTYMANAG